MIGTNTYHDAWNGSPIGDGADYQIGTVTYEAADWWGQSYGQDASPRIIRWAMGSNGEWWLSEMWWSNVHVSIIHKRNI